jgi:NADPH-dependent curcumin reductase CurA
LLQVVGKSISMNGFIITRLAHKYQDEFYKTVPKLVSAGKIR